METERRTRNVGQPMSGKRFAAVLSAAILLHASLIGAGVLWESFWSPPPEPQPEAIAVDLVEEPPAPEPEAAPEEKPPEPEEEPKQEPPPQPEPPPPAPPEEKVELPPAVPLDLPPAFDAPKSSQNDQELTKGDMLSEQPVAAAPQETPPPDPQKPAPEPAKPTPAPEPPPEPVKAEARPAPQDAPPLETPPLDPEGVPALAQAPPVENVEAEATVPEKPEKPEAPDAKRFAFFAPVPKMEFESSAKPSRAPAGKAEDSYTATLYGMIVPLVRVPPGLPSSARRRPLQVEFVVDGRGRLAGAAISRSSGVPSLDIAVLYAIRQAAPFPPTPHGKPLPLVLDYEPP